MLAEVTREIDDTRQMIRKAYFKQKLEMPGPLGQVLGGGRKEGWDSMSRDIWAYVSFEFMDTLCRASATALQGNFKIPEGQLKKIDNNGGGKNPRLSKNAKSFTIFQYINLESRKWSYFLLILML
jgi:hypothetical protein